jgi:hypothetical protein
MTGLYLHRAGRHCSGWRRAFNACEYLGIRNREAAGAGSILAAFVINQSLPRLRRRMTTAQPETTTVSDTVEPLDLRTGDRAKRTTVPSVLNRGLKSCRNWPSSSVAFWSIFSVKRIDGTSAAPSYDETMPSPRDAKRVQGTAAQGTFVTKKLTSQDTIIKKAMGRTQGNLQLTPGQEKTLRRAAAT